MDDKNIITVTPKMTMDKIQSCLKERGCTIKFSTGTYNITKTLYLFSNTTILLDNAILVRKNKRQIFTNYLNPKVSYNYNATENVTICGSGKLIGNGSTKVCSDISIMHCKNFIIEDIEFSKTYKSHALDISGCSDVIIKNVKFKDRIVNMKKLHKEEINIDFSFYSGFPYYPKGSKCFNGNHCKSITFDDVSFDNINTCIGSHTEIKSPKKHKNIVIKNCTANGVVIDGEGTFLNLVNTDGITFENNIIKGFERDITINALDTYYDSNSNKSTGIPSGKTGCNNILIKGNIFSNAKGKIKAAGIYITSESGLVHDNITITGNKFALNNSSAKYDIYISNAENVDVINNNTKLEIKVDKETTKNVKIA